MAEFVTISAPAKLNLALSVGPAGRGGMHPVCTWMVTVDLCDELEVTRLEADRRSRYAVLWHPEAKRASEIDWSMTSDLAVRAHQALEQRTGRPLPVQMKLAKRIPIGGGLGGGSSDAAAMLRATDVLFDLGLSDAELRSVAAELGSDVPFFVTGGSALAEGLGEEIKTHDEVLPLDALIVFPETACPTGRVYAVFDELGPGPLRADEVRALAAAATLRPDAPFNDLALAAARVVPELADLQSSLSALAQRQAHVAGSGSSLFVLCDDSLHAGALADGVEQRLGLPAVAVKSHQPSAISHQERHAYDNSDL